MGGKIVWFEVVGRDADKLQGFYSQMFGWKLNPAPTPVPYGLVDCDEGGIPGGVGQAPVGDGWSTFYIQVEDLVAAVEQAQGLGASVTQPPTRLPGGTHLAVLTDPEGHVFGMVEGQA